MFILYIRLKIRDFLNRTDVRNLVVRIAGEEGLDVLDNIPLNSSINEFKLAEKLDKNINKVRSVLYRFYTHRIVLFDKKRDKKKGWYIYFWKILPKNLVYLLKKEKEKELLSYKKRLEEGKETQFFGCEKCKQEFEYMKALENNFTCLNCGKVLKLIDKSKTVKAIEKEIEELKKEIKSLGKKKELEEEEKKEEEEEEKKEEKEEEKKVKKEKRKIKEKVKKKVKKEKKKIKEKVKKKVKKEKKKIKEKAKKKEKKFSIIKRFFRKRV